VTLVVFTVEMDAASEALAVFTLADNVVTLCAREELNVTFVVLTVEMDAASEELAVLTLADSVVML
jgi:hypothetical protein